MTPSSTPAQASLADTLSVVDAVLGSLDRRLPAHVSRDDLASAGKLALVEALLRFDGPPEQARAYCYVRVPRVTRAAIFERDRGVCQYSGEYVGKSGGNLDHVVPRDRGGRDSFENLVWAKKEINSLKANRLPHEAGLRLLRKPATPKPLPVAATVREARHPDWRHFLVGP